MIALQWHRLDAPGGGWRAHHGLRWRATVRKFAWGWCWTAERTDHEGAWIELAHYDKPQRRLADAQAAAGRAIERLTAPESPAQSRS